MDKDVLNSFVSTMTNMLKSAASFTMEQLPIVCKEVISYSIAQDVVWIVIGALMLSLYIWIIKKLRPLFKEDPEWAVAGVFSTALIAIPGIIMILCNVSDLCKATLAPRIYLIEYFAHLVVKS